MSPRLDSCEQLAHLIGKAESDRVLSLPTQLLGAAYSASDFRVEMMLRRYSRETRPWIQFHCDRAAVTVNVALRSDKLHEGGKLIVSL